CCILLPGDKAGAKPPPLARLLRLALCRPGRHPSQPLRRRAGCLGGLTGVAARREWNHTSRSWITRPAHRGQREEPAIGANILPAAVRFGVSIGSRESWPKDQCQYSGGENRDGNQADDSPPFGELGPARNGRVRHVNLV